MDEEKITSKKKKRWYLRWWAFIIYFLILIIVIGALSGDGEDGTETKQEQGEPQKQPQQQIQEEENLFGLTENQRKTILREIILCEDSADREVSKYYLSGCESCPEFIGFDVYKFAEKTQELTEICKEELRNKYNITEEIEIKIGLEGIEKGWKWPEPLPMPACCK